MSERWGPIALSLLGLLAVGCTGPLLANAVATAPPRSPEAPATLAAADPRPITLPADDGPHERLTEWWYYTGHLATDDGRPFGFEYVIFRAERGRFPVGWASHVAITDEAGERFLYDQRLQVGPRVDASSPGEGFDLAIAGDVAPGLPGEAEPWRMRGRSAIHALAAEAAVAPDGTAFGLELDLDDGAAAPLFHDHDGWVDFGPAGGSYYYSRPRMSASGVLSIGEERFPVTGSAWFDHQWGDFISVGGGWDWFAVNLDDGTDLTVSIVRDPGGAAPLVYGTIRDADGERHLTDEGVLVTSTGEWTSPTTAATWPSGWSIEVPADDLTIHLEPTLLDQELDTRASTGVVYWEGSQRVSADRGGAAIGGQAYVELTGYGPGLAP